MTGTGTEDNEDGMSFKEGVEKALNSSGDDDTTSNQRRKAAQLWAAGMNNFLDTDSDDNTNEGGQWASGLQKGEYQTPPGQLNGIRLPGGEDEDSQSFKRFLEQVKEMERLEQIGADKQKSAVELGRELSQEIEEEVSQETEEDDRGEEDIGEMVTCPNCGGSFYTTTEGVVEGDNGELYCSIECLNGV